MALTRDQLMVAMRDTCKVDEKAAMMASCLVAELEPFLEFLMVVC